MERDVHCPQCPCDRIQQTHLLGVELLALTGDTVHPHQTVASIKQPGNAHARQFTRKLFYASFLSYSRVM